MRGLNPYISGTISVGKGIINSIGSPHDNEFDDGGNQCYNTVYVKLYNKAVVGCSENCEVINNLDIGKIVTVKFVNNKKMGNAIFNKILFVENNEINNYLGQSELIMIVLFLWGGSFLLLAYGDIRRNFKEQLKKEEIQKMPHIQNPIMTNIRKLLSVLPLCAFVSIRF